MFEPYVMEPEIRQGGIISADLFKIYVNPLLLRIQYSDIGVKICKIEYPGSACADDIRANANTQTEAQILADRAGGLAGKQFYEIQADKSATVVTPYGIHLMRNKLLSQWTVRKCEQSTHLGIQSPSGFTINQNITKARKPYIVCSRWVYMVKMDLMQSLFSYSENTSSLEKSPGNATITNRSQTPTPRGREK